MNDGTICVVASQGKLWLPGGGSLPGDTPEQTVSREVLEELGCIARPTSLIGRAIQYFYAADENRHYRMEAVFLRAGPGDAVPAAIAEHPLLWIPIDQALPGFYHECHAWAVMHY